MLDSIATIVLFGMALGIPLALILIASKKVRRHRLLMGIYGWLAVIAGLAANDVFTPSKVGTLGIGVIVMLPIIFGVVAYRWSVRMRTFVSSIPLEWMITAHVGRLLGVFFLLLLAAGRLPWTFATAAGWGDIVIGAAAPLVAWLAYKGFTGARGIGLLWNTLGLADLVLAVTLGVGSAADSPARFIYESTDSGTMASLPWLLVPGFLVPIYILLHLAIFQRLRAYTDRTYTREVPV